MLKNSLKKLFAAGCAAAMLSSAFSPLAGAVILNSPAQIGTGTFVTADDIDAIDGKTDGEFKVTTGYVEKKLTASTKWPVGKYLTFKFKINSACKNTGKGQNDHNGLAFLFMPSRTDKTGPSLTIGSSYTLPDAADLTKGTANNIVWKGTSSSGKELKGTFNIGEEYTVTLFYEDSKKIQLEVKDNKGDVVCSGKDLNTRTASDAGDTLEGVTVRVDNREEGKDSSVTVSDIKVYSSAGAGEIEVKIGDTVLANTGNEPVEVPSSGTGSEPIVLEGEVKTAEDDTNDYKILYSMAEEIDGVYLEDNKLHIKAVADSSTKPVIRVQLADKNGIAYPDAYSDITLSIKKDDATPEEYVEDYAQSLVLKDINGKEIKIKNGVYTFEDGFEVFEGSGSAEVVWSCWEKSGNKWVKSDIIDTDTGKYTPKADYHGNIKLVATVSSTEDDSVTAEREFICNVSSPDRECDMDIDWLDEFMEDYDGEIIDEDIKLPTTGSYGSSIVWTSSNPSVVSTKGKITRKDTNKTVTLTATIEKGSQSVEKEYTVTVKKKKTTSTGGSGGISGTSTKITGIGVVSTVAPTIAPTIAPATPAPKAEFTDINSVEWAKEAITTLANRGVINGKTETSFAPNDDITRAEFAKILISAFGLVTPNSKVSALNDVKDENAWYYEPIASAYNKGIIKGHSDGSFGINEKVTRQDMAVMIYRAAQAAKNPVDIKFAEIKFDDEDKIADYAKEAVTALQRAGVINGVSDTQFAPTATATRAQAAKMVFGLVR